MGMPLLIGAGIGALGSAAMGKSPFTGALLGGATGGMLGGAGGLFGAAGGASAAAPVAGAVGTTGEIGGGLLTTAGGLGGGSVALPAATSGALSSPSILAGQGSNLTGAGMLNAGQVTPSLLNSVGAGGAMTNAGAIPLTTMDRVGNYISNLPSNAMDWVEKNPLSAGKMALDVATPAPQQQIQPSQGQISRPNFDPSSTLVNVSPNVSPTSGSKRGVIDMMAHIPMTDEERLRLQQLGYQG